jgi:tetratricopeptide (TPR) repeat protein
MSDCPSHEALALWLETGDSDPGLAQHVEACPRCQEQLERLTALNDTPGPAPAGELSRLRCLLHADAAAPNDEAAPHWPTLPGYEFLGELGRGGVGVVFKARQASPNRLVAVKMLRDFGGATPEEVVRFGVEAETVARLQHPNIVQIYEAGISRQQPFFVLEYVAGGNLDDRLAGRPMPPHQAAALVEAVARAIQHAHEQGIVHRDLKPANVLLTADGTPKVADFGMARLLNSDLRLTRTGSVAGTPAYMAPEQARPGMVEVGPTADVYALGAILYECLTGRPPFVGETALDVLALVADTEPVPPSRLVPSVPRDLETICLKCLQKDPRQRYASAADFADDLRRFQEGRTVIARPVGAAGRAWRWCRRNPGTGSALAGTALALVAGAVVSLLFAMEASRTAAAEKSAREDADRNAEHARINAAKAVAEKARADDEADLARGVSDFLRYDLLLQADPQTHANPNQSPDRDIKLRRILDQAASRIEGRFPGRPLVEAALRNSIGIAYSGLGEYDLALTHLQAAYDVQKKLLGADHPDSLSTVVSLGVVYQRKARYQLAEEIAAAAFAQSRKRRGPDHPGTLLIQSNLSAVYLEQGRYGEAGPLLESAWELFRRKQVRDDHLEISLLLNLSGYYRARGDFKRAENLLVQARENVGKKLGEDHPLTLNCQHNLASLYQQEGRLAEAQKLLVRTWKAREKYLGADHPITLNCEANLANLYVRQFRHADAESAYLRVLSKQRQQLGEEHHDTLATQQNLAQLYVTRGQFEQAEPLLRKTLDVRRKTLGEDHLDTITSLHGLALYYLARRRHREAEPLFLRTLDTRRTRLGDNHPETLVAQNNLAAVYIDMDQPERAAPLLQKTFDARRRHLGLDHPMTVSCQANLGLACLRLGEYQRSESLFAEAVAGHRRVGNSERLAGLQTRNNQALLHLVQGKLNTAKAMYESLLSDARKKLGDKHPLTVQAVQTLAVFPELKNAAHGYQSTLSIKGADHAETVTARLKWAVVVRDRVGLRYAVPHAEAVVAARRRLQKADHPDTLEAIQLLAAMRQRLGQIGPRPDD